MGRYNVLFSHHAVTKQSPIGDKQCFEEDDEARSQIWRPSESGAREPTGAAAKRN